MTNDAQQPVVVIVGARREADRRPVRPAQHPPRRPQRVVVVVQLVLAEFLPLFTVTDVVTL